jgi:2-hydroxychromene-2-carboxylate isomerase
LTKEVAVTPIVFWFDVVSPYAWLAFERLPQALEGHSHVVEYRPVLFAGLLRAWGQKGPAEIEPKRAWTYRYVQWLAHEQGTVLELPRPHPFNPLTLLRLALAACEPGVMPNRRIVEAVFRHAWCRAGADPNEPAALAELADRLPVVRRPDGADVKDELRSLTEAAVRQGVFGVPTLVARGRPFWGQDALPMLAACISGEPWFDGPQWDEAASQPLGVVRTG